MMVCVVCCHMTLGMADKQITTCPSDVYLGRVGLSAREESGTKVWHHTKEEKPACCWKFLIRQYCLCHLWLSEYRLTFTVNGRRKKLSSDFFLDRIEIIFLPQTQFSHHSTEFCKFPFHQSLFPLHQSLMTQVFADIVSNIWIPVILLANTLLSVFLKSVLVCWLLSCPLAL